MSNLQILYGIEKIYADVTNRTLLYNFLFNKNYEKVIKLPDSDFEKSNIFPDHLEGVVKHILINDKIYHHGEKIEIDVSEDKTISDRVRDVVYNTEPELKLQMLHRNLRFMHGTINDEVPEQIMACMFIEPGQTVLELGSNLGRNTLVISSLLKDSSQLVTLETDSKTAEKLKNNRDINEFRFKIENSALFAESPTRLLLQPENSWDTKVSDTLLPRHNKVNTITFHELESKYEKKFDTMVVDCEGSLYYIFQDFPDILNHIKMIIMENDYHNISHKKSVDDFMIKNGFTCVFRKSGGWGPCYPCFYETWKKL